MDSVSTAHSVNFLKIKQVVTNLVDASNTNRLATTTIKFNWDKTNALLVSHAQEDKSSTELPILALTKL
jgi:hypothetical protein